MMGGEVTVEKLYKRSNLYAKFNILLKSPWYRP
jgi:hypothetical protein